MSVRSSTQPGLFALETLEARVLLSGDVAILSVPQSPLPDSVLAQEHAGLLAAPSASDLPLSSDYEVNAIFQTETSALSSSRSTPASDFPDGQSPQPAGSPVVSSPAAPARGDNASANNLSDASVARPSSEAISPSGAELAPGASASTDAAKPAVSSGAAPAFFAVNDLVEILRGANGPPAETISSSAASGSHPLFHQLIYINAGGAAGILFNGEVRVADIVAPAFEAKAGLAGHEAEIISILVRLLNERYDSLGLQFTAVDPGEGNPHSTVYLGGDDHAFAAWGRFLGLAQHVDHGNQDPNDIA
ncbi:MAG: LEPR-XLL domain-containing protein, partial [Verrucomicrobia bacterium]|nr:LEPR-XLL domain-containing protein [Verrucomicrobiota bacterium]